MTPFVEKIVAVWEKEPGLCAQTLAFDRLGDVPIGCAVGSLLMATGCYESAAQLSEEVNASLAGHSENVLTALALLTEHYGLSERETMTLMAWNDGVATAFRGLKEGRAYRRDYMIAKVREHWGSA